MCKLEKTTFEFSWSLQYEETRWNSRIGCFLVWKLVETTCEVSWSFQCEERRLNRRVDCDWKWLFLSFIHIFMKPYYMYSFIPYELKILKWDKKPKHKQNNSLCYKNSRCTWNHLLLARLYCRTADFSPTSNTCCKHFKLTDYSLAICINWRLYKYWHVIKQKNQESPFSDRFHYDFVSISCQKVSLSVLSTLIRNKVWTKKQFLSALQR